MADILKKKSTKKLTNSQKITILVSFVGGCCAIIAACIGLGIPIIETSLNTIIEKVDSIPTRTSTPPSNAVQLPASHPDVLSIAVNPGPSWAIWAGLLTENIDRTVLTQNIDQRNVIFPGDVSPRFTEVNWPSTFWIILTGKSTGEPVQISNRVPIKLVSYQPLPDEVDLVSMQIGGGEDVWLLSVDMSEDVLSFPDQIVWAEYAPDLQARLVAAQEETPYLLESYPSEIQRVISSDAQPLPDYFLLTNNERIVLSVAAFFQTPGVYRLQFGVEYLYSGYKTIAWTEPTIDVYAPGDYYVWVCDLTDQSTNPSCNLFTFCEFQPASGYTCTYK